jgi:hypothetical protein
MKNVISQFINTALIIYIISFTSQGFKSKKYLTDNGLVLQVTDLIVISGFIDIAMNLLHKDHVYKIVKNWWKYKKYIGILKKEKINMLQMDLNKEY